MHAHNTFVPTLNYLPNPDHKRQWLSAVLAAVKFSTVRRQRAFKQERRYDSDKGARMFDLTLVLLELASVGNVLSVFLEETSHTITDLYSGILRPLSQQAIVQLLFL